VTTSGIITSTLLSQMPIIGKLVREALPWVLKAAAFEGARRVVTGEEPSPVVPPQTEGVPNTPPIKESYLPAISPSERLWLDTISFMEGTWNSKKNAPEYRMMFGGGLAPNLDIHPDNPITSGRHTSAAAGAYQFMPFTWDSAAKALKLRSFGPVEQDHAALRLLRNRGVDPSVDPISPDTLHLIAGEWAASPLRSGASYYAHLGQRAKAHNVIFDFARRRRQQLIP